MTNIPTGYSVLLTAVKKKKKNKKTTKHQNNDRLQHSLSIKMPNISGLRPFEPNK
jgi:hypothetical protein